jgi:SAM-dependent methyltransferase
MNNNNLLARLNQDLSYSVRRYFVDKFYFEKIALFKAGQKILDMGGLKVRKRGLFNIEKYGLIVEYANLSEKSEPDYLCDVCSIPVKDESFNGVIISEVLEHVRDPKLVLLEAYRILKPDGKLLICVPFMLHVHADPNDYGRYTDQYFREILSELRFKNITITKQGYFFSVLTNMLKIWVYNLVNQNNKFSIKLWLLKRLVSWLQRSTFKWEESEKYKNSPVFQGYTTGYGISCVK